jgi:sporulation protein YlmC with PRC-barrel domain
MDYFFPGPAGFRDTTYDSTINVENTAFSEVTRENIPAGELSLAPGMEIDASDGKVGELDEIVLDPSSGKITHLLAKEGPFWRRKEVLIPVPSVMSVDGQAIHLRMDKKTVSQMPAVAMKH